MAIGKLWGRLGKGPRITIILVIVLLVFALAIVGKKFFGATKPEVVLYPEALWSIGGKVTDARGVPLTPDKVSGFPITNTMLGAWLTLIVFGLIMFFATRKMKLVPRGLQNLVEMAVEAISNFVDSVAGKENGRKFFPILGHHILLCPLQCLAFPGPRLHEYRVPCA